MDLVNEVEMRKLPIIAGVMVAFLASSAVPAMAFQSVPVTPPSGDEQSLDAKDLGFDLSLGEESPKPKKAKKDHSILGDLGLSSKLNFGLELMYGDDPSAAAATSTDSLSTVDPNDVSIMGKIKRTF